MLTFNSFTDLQQELQNQQIIRGLTGEAYVRRLDLELEALRKRKSLTFKQTAKKHILAAYLLGLSDIDPVAAAIPPVYAGTPNLPDLDIDISSESQSSAESFLKETYGEKRVMHVVTYMTYKGKGALRNICKTLGATHQQANDILALSKSDDAATICADVTNNLSKLKAYTHNWVDDNWETVVSIACKIEGVIGSLGSHSAGICVSDDDIDKQMPMIMTKTGIKAAYSEGLGERELSDLGFVKYDFLGLRTLAVIRTLKESLGKDWKAPDVTDPAIYDAFAEGDTDFVFQFASESMKGILKGVKPKSVADLAACNALYRPASIKYVSQFVNDSFASIDPILDPILGETRNVMLYQEQTLAIFRELGGFSMLEAENARKAIKLVTVPNPSKEALRKFDKIVEKFRKGCVARGVRPATQKAIVEAIKESSKYSFNKCLAPETEVIVMNNGKADHRAVDSVVVGDYVLAFDINAQANIYAKVLTVYRGSSKQLYRFTAGNGHEIVCSDEHKLLTRDGLQSAGKCFNLGLPVLVTTVDDSAPIEEKLVSMAFVREGPVIDIEIDHADHVFVAQGFIVANSHSVSYACLAAETMYYKIYYPLHFFLATLQHAGGADAEEDRALAVKKLRNLGLSLSLGDINTAGTTFKPITEGKQLILPLTLLSNVRSEKVAALLETRPFVDVDDFFIKAKKTCDKRSVEILWSAGILPWSKEEFEERFLKTYKAKEVKHYELFDLLGFELEDRSDGLRHLFNNMKVKFPRLQTIEASRRPGCKALTGFFIESTKQRKSKKGKVFHVLKVTDGSSDTQCYLFANDMPFEPGEVVIAETRASDFGLQLIEVKAHVKI